MKKIIIHILLLCIVNDLFSQNAPTIKAGEMAPAFVLNLEQNTIQGFTMPYLNKIVLLHFWSTTLEKSQRTNRYLSHLLARYKESEYINAEGFEIISVAVQTDRNSWKETIKRDSLSDFIHGIALKGFSEDVCAKYGVTSIPSDILIDETGKIIAINPKILDVENILDSKKNVHPLKKDIHGILAQSSSIKDLSKFTKVFLFNHFGDSLSYTRTNAKGEFMFHEIKLNQDFILKVDNQMDILTSDPIALYSVHEELLLEGKTRAGGFEFFIPSKLSFQLTEEDSAHIMTNSTLEISVTKVIEFKNGGAGLTPKDEQEINSIFHLFQKHKNAVLEFNVHTDTQLDPKAAKMLTDKQTATLRSYFIKKGVPLSRIRSFSMGNNSLRKLCPAPDPCSKEDHKMNRRVEFAILKN